MAQLQASILQQTSLDDHEERLKAANAALKKSRHDVDALHVRVVALLKLDRYEDALRAFEDGGDTLRARAPLEHAYALYKTGDLTEAEKIAKTAKGDRGLQHVEAQAVYRAEKFARAAELYQSLSAQGLRLGGEENDMKINVGATRAQLEWSGQGHLLQERRPGREDLEAFETAYNAACGSIARGELAQGEILLKRARDLCNASEDLSNAEKASELLPITVQLVYVLSRLGRQSEAEKLCSSIKISDITELSTRHVAQSNALAVATEQNPFLAQRLFHSTPNLSKKDQPFSFQSSLLRFNGYAIDLRAMKYAGVARSTASYVEKQSLPSTAFNVTSSSVINAAATARNLTGKAALKEVLPLLEKRPNDIGLVLTVIQLYLLDNNHGSAISVMESFFGRLERSSNAEDQDVRFAPGLVATMVSLYGVQGRTTHVRSELGKAARFWRQRASAPQALLKAAGMVLLQSSKQEDQDTANDIFSSLYERNPSDAFVNAGYIAAKSVSTPSSITPQHVSQLPSLSTLTSATDITGLEEAGVARTPSSTLEQSRKRAGEDATKPVKPKKQRKSRLPKTYDPSKLPDPERWLPMRDRSYYRPKGKKGKQRQAMATQGVSEQRPTGPAVMGVEQLKGGSASKAQAKKKRGKGGK